MQTFLPYPDFEHTARVLDWRRLGKQRVEAKQILLALARGTGGWINHPAVRMWRGYEPALAIYGATICQEWRDRGYRDNLLPWFHAELRRWWLPSALAGTADLLAGGGHPPWLGDPAFHASHRSNLLRKAPEHYGQFGWTEPDDLVYVWPTPEGEKGAADAR
ncbi:MAG: MSMEG_6728 family protein [Gemmatimonadota bacterium]|nr:MAG: MSMEG_6728 family protein [Gemmatimonadota bacterium]